MADTDRAREIARTVAKSIDHCLFRGCEDKVVEAYAQALRDYRTEIIEQRAEDVEAERDRLKDENQQLRELVESAYNEGFGEGMKDFTHSNGGKGWTNNPRSRKKLEALTLKEQDND